MRAAAAEPTAAHQEPGAGLHTGRRRPAVHDGGAQGAGGKGAGC